MHSQINTHTISPLLRTERRGAVGTPGSYPTHCLLSITFILCSSSSQRKPLIHWVYMEIHGNAFTVWSVWGAEYQSSVSSGDWPFTPHYLKDGEQRDHTGRPSASATKEPDRGCSVSYQCWRSTCERNRYDSPPLELLEWNLFNLNFYSRDYILFSVGPARDVEWSAAFLNVDISVTTGEQILAMLLPKMSVSVMALRPARQHYSDRCLMQDWFTWLHYHLPLCKRIQQPA